MQFIDNVGSSWMDVELLIVHTIEFEDLLSFWYVFVEYVIFCYSMLFADLYPDRSNSKTTNVFSRFGKKKIDQCVCVCVQQCGIGNELIMH